MTEESKYDRRQFMAAAAITVAATQVRISPYAGAASRIERLIQKLLAEKET